MSVDISSLGRAAQEQIAAKLAAQLAVSIANADKKAKYHNQPTMRGGMRFDSKKEARRFDELALLQNAGKIRDLKLQPQFTLQESYVTPDGERVRAIRYVADFSYQRPTTPDAQGTVHWVPVVEDVKSAGTRTAQYKIKRKMFREKYGFEITEV